MNKKLIPVLALGMVSILAACNKGGNTWQGMDKGGTVNYALLIGQIDHNDSAARTKGIREALGTRPTTHATNANTETPVEGSIVGANGKTYKVVEIEHAEQKNTAGATWDQATATSTTETWLNKHANDTWTGGSGQGISFFVSNNDGMAVGALGATNWPTGMPIFGYDSNADALQYIKDGKIMGTINQNASDQAAGIFMAARNAMDGLTGTDVYTKGFSVAGDFGKISANYTYNATNKSMLVDNFAITSTNVDKYLGKTAADLIDTGITKKSGAATKNVFLSIYSSSDTFLHSNVLPLMKLYQDKFAINYGNTYEGDGNTETGILDKIDAASAADGYMINMIKTTSTATYLDHIATKLNATEAAPSSVPVIFWNRQGTDAQGAVDSAVMTDKRFKTVLYVGFDAIQGGVLQGTMVADYVKAALK